MASGITGQAGVGELTCGQISRVCIAIIKGSPRSCHHHLPAILRIHARCGIMRSHVSPWDSHLTFPNIFDSSMSGHVKNFLSINPQILQEFGSSDFLMLQNFLEYQPCLRFGPSQTHLIQLSRGCPSWPFGCPATLALKLPPFHPFSFLVFSLGIGASPLLPWCRYAPPSCLVLLYNALYVLLTALSLKASSWHNTTELSCMNTTCSSRHHHKDGSSFSHVVPTLLRQARSSALRLYCHTTT